MPIVTTVTTDLLPARASARFFCPNLPAAQWILLGEWLSFQSSNFPDTHRLLEKLFPRPNPSGEGVGVLQRATFQCGYSCPFFIGATFPPACYFSCGNSVAPSPYPRPLFPDDAFDLWYSAQDESALSSLWLLHPQRFFSVVLLALPPHCRAPRIASGQFIPA